MPTIEGVYAAALTPRRLGSQEINLGVMWETIDFLVAHKVQGIVLHGTTGEFVHYSPAERMRTTGLAPKRSRVPVIVNVSHSTLDGCVEMAQAANASGAAGVLLMPPYFFRYDQHSIRAFYEKFASEAGISIPVLLYNIPQFTNAVDIETAEGLLRDGLVQGVKDSSGDWPSMERLLAVKEQTGATVMVGHDLLYPRARAQGANGAVSGIAAAVPELVVGMERQPGLGARLEEFIAWCEKLPTPVIVREAAISRGLKMGPHAMPLSAGQTNTVHEFREWFGPWLKAVQEEAKGA